MKNLTKLIAICSVFLFAGCDSDDQNIVEGTPVPPPTVASLKLQVLHASPDAPEVNVYVNGDLTLPEVDYKTGSGALELPPADYGVRIEGIVPGGNVDVFDDTVQLLGNFYYTIAAIGSLADETFTPFIFFQDDVPVTAGSARVFVFHGAENAPAVDVYVTDPDTELAPGVAPLGTFAYTQTLGPVEVPAGDYRIRVTAAGDEDPANGVLYDSGSIGLAGGDDFTIAAVTNTNVGADEQPVSLVVMTGAGSIELPTADTPTQLQAVHASPDAGLVDIVVDGGVAASIDFTQATGYLQVPAGTYNIAVNPAGSDMSAIGPVDLDLAPGIRHDVVAVGSATDMTLEPLVLTDDPRRVATEAKVRIVHGASNPAAALVDIYVTAVDAGIADVDPTLPGVAYKANTGFLGLPAGVDYDVTVTIAGTKDIAIGPATLPVLNAGGIYTAIARDPDPTVMGDGFGVILLDDFIIIEP
jgi:hypothetical protein